MNDSIRHSFRIAANVFIIRDNKVLLGRRFQSGYMDGYYGVIGGHLEPGESLKQAATRELKEEVGLIVTEDTLKFVHLMHHLNDSPRLQVFFVVSDITGEPKIMEPDRCDDLRWFDFQELPEMVVPYVKEALAMVIKNQSYCEFYS